MKIPRAPHRWHLSPREAIAVQKRLAAAVRPVPPRHPLRLVAGLDAAFSHEGERCIAGVVLWDRSQGAVVEQRVATRRLSFPYVPGLLSFREAPALLAALRKLHRTPHLLLCDGHGLAHPRRFGIACHLGILTGLPSAGCAKSRLVGSHGDPGRERGSRARLESEGEVIGTVLRTRTAVKPVFVSVGHRIDLASAERVVLDCAVGYRLPEPTRLADRLVAAAKRGARGA
jgi:deoxyribonuclease V